MKNATNTLDPPCARQASRGPHSNTGARMERVLGSNPIGLLKATLDRVGLTIEPTPILYKYVTDRLLRVMFPVTGGKIVRGAVVSVVCLFDCRNNETLYAHPMHAGPEVNPLLKHLDGPMATPKAQPGADGDHATKRIMDHKQALWARFRRERETLGLNEAGRRWRAGYYWALKRLYFCTRCTYCRWGNPFFDGPDPGAPLKAVISPIPPMRRLAAKTHADTLEAVVTSDAWRVEAAYAQRGGFTVSAYPWLVKDLGNGFVQTIFPTDAVLLQGGTLVALSAVHYTQRRETVFAHCLCAGPNPELQFLLGDKALGLPQPCANGHAAQARVVYASWRRDAWSRFWLDELEKGLAVASENWLSGFWSALQELFGGNDLRISSEPERHDYIGIPSDRVSMGDQGRSSVWSPASQNRATDVNRAMTYSYHENGPTIPFETIENIGGTCFAGHATEDGSPQLRAVELSTLMVNLGLRCNQSCTHCHVDAGPHRTEEMSRETVELVLDVLRRNHIETVDITGGAPEMNPHFRHLARTASQLCMRVVDRCNLTIFFEVGYEDLPDFLAEYDIEITASLPCYQHENVDRQRGKGTFRKSIAALKTLNALGYGNPGTRRVLNLVYNPAETDLAPPEEALEQRYRCELRDRFGIVFNHLFTMNNLPVKRFRDHLAREGRLSSYMDRLVGAFNPATVEGLMCRHAILVGPNGNLYDCDFNHALGIPLNHGLPAHIRSFDASLLRARAINTGPHCFGCAAGAGSSCNGALAATSTIAREWSNARASCVKALETHSLEQT